MVNKILKNKNRRSFSTFCLNLQVSRQEKLCYVLASIPYISSAIDFFFLTHFWFSKHYFHLFACACDFHSISRP